jgi:hypothetical protein
MVPQRLVEIYRCSFEGCVPAAAKNIPTAIETELVRRPEMNKRHESLYAPRREYELRL